jgi:hypothetical protein
LGPRQPLLKRVLGRRARFLHSGGRDMFAGHAVHPTAEATLALMRISDEYSLVSQTDRRWSGSERLWWHGELTISFWMSEQEPAPAVGGYLALRSLGREWCRNVTMVRLPPACVGVATQVLPIGSYGVRDGQAAPAP